MSEKDRKPTDVGSTKPWLGHHPCVSRVSSMQIYGRGGLTFSFRKKVRQKERMRDSILVLTRASDARRKYRLTVINSSGQTQFSFLRIKTKTKTLGVARLLRKGKQHLKAVLSNRFITRLLSPDLQITAVGICSIV